MIGETASSLEWRSAKLNEVEVRRMLKICSTNASLRAAIAAATRSVQKITLPSEKCLCSLHRKISASVMHRRIADEGRPLKVLKRAARQAGEKCCTALTSSLNSAPSCARDNARSLITLLMTCN